MLIKPGVTRLEALPRRTTLLGRRKRIAIHLYGEILSGSPAHDHWLAVVLEQFSVPGGAVKRTHDDRLAELDAALCAELEPQRPSRLRVHDAGASDGRTSVVLADRLAALAPTELTMSDEFRLVDVVRQLRHGYRVAFDEDGRLVQLTGLGLVLSVTHPDRAWLYPVNRLAQRWLERRIVPAARAALESVPPARRRELCEVPAGGFGVTRIPLVCREALERARRGRDFRVARQDVRQPLPERYDVVRIVNVLNHLDRTARIAALRNAHASLVEGGLLVAGRISDPDGRTRATIWRRRGAGLEVVRQLGDGAEDGALLREALGEPATALIAAAGAEP